MPQILYLTTVEFEAGAIRLLPKVLTEVSIERPLIVTDRGVVRAGLLERLNAVLPFEWDGPVFTETPPNPTEDAVEAAVAIYRQQSCDGIIALGGGSSIDLAKGVALLASHPGPLEQYAAILGGMTKISAAVKPVVAIPTTAGTGSEVGRGALITLRDGRKLGFLSPHLIPKRAICDPDLTLGLPPGLTAATGMDALSHCIETFLSPRINPPAEAIAIDGAARAWKWIERAVSDGHDGLARWHMMMASLQGGLTFQKGLGAVHSLSHALGGLKDPVLHHGTLNAVLMPAVLRFNQDHVGDKYARLRQALELPSHADLGTAVLALNARLKLPPNLRAMGVAERLADYVAERAAADHSTPTNPRPAGPPEFRELFLEALG